MSNKYQVYKYFDYYGEKQPRSLNEFIENKPILEIHNNYFNETKNNLINEILYQKRWRHHHNIEELKKNGNLYKVYVERVDAMIASIHKFLLDMKIDTLNMSTCDLAAAEGFVANYFLEKNIIKHCDLYELSEINHKRINLIQSLKQIQNSRLFQLDFDYINWSSLIPNYDLVFCLGIIYHNENPLIFLRNLYKITKKILIIESDTPLSNVNFRENGIFFLNNDQVTLDQNTIRFIKEMRPNRKALIETLLYVGFKEVIILQQDEKIKSKYYSNSTKTIMVATK